VPSSSHAARRRPRSPPAQPSPHAVNATAAFLTPAAATTPEAGVARRDLERRVLRLVDALANAVNGSVAQRREAEGMWVTTLGEIAAHAAGTVEEVRRINRVECPEGYFDRKPGLAAVGVLP
jgi:hypothetical protein